MTPKPKYKIIHYTNGHFGYKNYFDLMQWNPVYKHWVSISAALDIKFIEAYCIIKNIDYKSIPIKQKK